MGLRGGAKHGSSNEIMPCGLNGYLVPPMKRHHIFGRLQWEHAKWLGQMAHNTCATLHWKHAKWLGQMSRNICAILQGKHAKWLDHMSPLVGVQVSNGWFQLGSLIWTATPCPSLLELVVESQRNLVCPVQW